MTSALLVIDFQNTVFDSPPAYHADDVLARIASLIARARAAGLPVIYVQHEAPGTSWQAGSAGWHFPAAIAPLPGDFVSPKYNSSAFQESELLAHLERHGIARLYVCGYATEFCIDTNLRHAAALKLQPVIISDAHTTRNRPHMDAPAIIEHHHWIWSGIGGVDTCTSDTVPFAGG